MDTTEETEYDRLLYIGGPVFAALETVLRDEDFTKKDFTISWVYVLKNPATGLYKIGKSTNINQRVKTISMQSGVWVELICAAYIETFHTDYSLIETLLHRHFKPKRVIGEWFSLSTQDVLDIYSAFGLLNVDDMIWCSNFDEIYQRINE